MSACTFMSSKFAGRAPAGHVLLRAFFGGARDPNILRLGDADLRRLALEELGPLLGLKDEPRIARVYRWPSATPQLEVGHLERVRAIEGALAGSPGLFLAGAGLRVTGIPDCIGDGRGAATSALAFVSSL